LTKRRIFTIVTLLVIAAAPNLYAAHCSNASLHGTYAYSSQGFAEVTLDINATGFVPWAQSGLIVYDGKGNITSGTFTASTTTANGGSFRGTFTGTYAVNRDCTGAAATNLGDGTISNFDLLVERPEKVIVINTDPGGFMSIFTVRKIVREKDEGEGR